MSARRNPGHCPPDLAGRRIRATTVQGGSFEAPAEGKGAPRWTIEGSPHDIATFEVLA